MEGEEGATGTGTGGGRSPKDDEVGREEGGGEEGREGVDSCV